MLKEDEILAGRDLSGEFIFKTSRSSGAGGQHVNKVSSKVELRFHIDNSLLLTADEKAIVLVKLANRISNEGYLSIVSQISRSQLENKKEAIEKFYLLLNKALKPVKKRKPTKPGKVAKAKRLDNKRMIGQKKEGRKKVDNE